jgi:exopolyphosphatase/guanosine-5'-triphosphate,3'-diphosphate pyrophosphatase
LKKRPSSDTFPIPLAPHPIEIISDRMDMCVPLKGGLNDEHRIHESLCILSKKRGFIVFVTETILAFIDIGSHTARLLVCQTTGSSKGIRLLVRKRSYIRLAENFIRHRNGKIQVEAMERAVTALEEFSSIVKKMRVGSIQAVCTGVVREAENRYDFLNKVFEHTGIQARVLSGEEEARLTAKGVLHALENQGSVPMIFDLGGGSTEFIHREKDIQRIQSLPLGALVLTQRYLVSDPPGKEEMDALEQDVDDVLAQAFPGGFPKGEGPIVGTGGTVTTLAAMLYHVDVEEISPKRMNGVTLRREQLEDLFERLRAMTFEERCELQGLDRGRADVILAGCAVVIRILRFFRAPQMMVSLSDLLEGMVLVGGRELWMERR